MTLFIKCNYNQRIVSYETIDRQYPLLDLVAGAFFKNQNSIIWLTEMRASFIENILNSGVTGIQQFELATLVYGEHSISLKYLVNRLRNISLELSRIGLNFTLENGHYFFIIPNSLNVIQCKTKNFLGPLAYLQTKHTIICVNDTAKTLKISTRKAALLFKDWKKKKLIYSNATLPYGKYFIKSIYI